MNVKELRKQAKDRYQGGKGQTNLKGYSRLGKAALLSKLGMSDEAKAVRSKTTQRKAAAFQAAKEGGDSAVKKAQVKGRILRSVKRGLADEQKKQGRELTQQEKRSVAAKSLASEVKAIKSGKPENKPKRGNGQTQKSSFSHTPPSGVSVAEHRAALRRQYGAETGTRTENLSKREKRRADIGLGDQGESQIRRREVSDRVSEPKTKPLTVEVMADLPKKQTMSDRIRATADKIKAETDLQKKATARILGAAAQIAQNQDRLIDEVSGMVNKDLDNAEKKRKAKKVRGKKSPPVSRGTRTKPTAFDDAPTTIAQPRVKTVRGRTID